MPTYEKPDTVIKPTPNTSHRMCFNLIRHRGMICDIPVEKLFKSFTIRVRSADSAMVILPFQAAKQHYLSLTNIDITLLNLYYQKQQYSLSRYMHVSSTLTFDQLHALPTLLEGLDTYNYFIKLCPSHNEEMTPIGALCYSNIFMHCEDLKRRF